MVQSVSEQWCAALPVHGVHVTLPHAPGDGAAHHVQVATVFTGRRDLVAQTVLAVDTDGVVLVAVERYSQGVCPRLLLTDQVDVDILSDFLGQNVTWETKTPKM